MRSKTSFFNKTLFLKTVCRFWPIWGGYLFIWLVALPLQLGSSLSWAMRVSAADSYGQSLMSVVQSNPLSFGHDTGLIMSVLFCLFMAMAVYGFLYFSRSAGAYCSLPLDRRCLFITLTAAGIVPLLLANVAVFLVAILVELAFGVLYLPALLGFLALTSMEVLFFFGLAAICAMLTGNIVVLPPLYAILNFCAFVLEIIVQSLMEQFVYGYHSPGTHYLRFLSPVVKLWQDGNVVRDGYYEAVGEGQSFITTGYHFEGYLSFAIYAAIGAALLIGAYHLLKRRSIESAGDVVAVKPLRPVFKYCMAVGCALALGLLLFSATGASSHSTSVQAAALLLFLLLGCFLGYFASEMMLKKTFRVFRGKSVWLGFGVTCALLASLFLCCEFDAFGYERRLPDPSKVENVYLSGNGNACYLSEKENIDAAIALQRQVIENKAWHEVDQTGNGVRLNLTYTLQNGDELTRSYDLRMTIDDSTDAYCFQALMNTQEAIDYRKATAYPIAVDNIDYAAIEYVDLSAADSEKGYWQSRSLTDEEAYELYTTCILPDIADGTLGRIWFIEDENYINTVYNCSINIECNRRVAGSGAYEYLSFYTVPTVDSKRTNAWLSEHGIDPVTYAEAGQTPWYEWTDAYTYPYDGPAAAAVEYQKYNG